MFFIILFSSIAVVKGAEFGYSSHSEGSVNISANQLRGGVFSTSLLGAGEYVGDTGHVWGQKLSNNVYVKMIILDDDRHIFAVSQAAYVTDASVHMVNFTFYAPFTLDKALSDNYTIAFIASVNYFYMADGGAAGELYDTSNSYGSPEDPSDVSFLGTEDWVNGWLDVTYFPTVTVSPSPSPVVTQVPSYPMPDPFVAVPSYYMVLLVLFAVVAVLAGLYVTFERESENKGVALLFVLVGLVLFVVLIVGYFVGF